MNATAALLNDQRVSATADSTRLDYLDATRAFALLLGVIFHASMSFSPYFMGWAVQDVSTSELVSDFIQISHSFRMETFFLLAGFFSHRLLHRRGLGEFVRSRAVRLGIPFVVGWFLLRPLIVSGWIMGAASLRGDYDFWASLRGGFESLKTLPAGIFTGSHLWFLYYLLLITALTLVGRAFVLRIAQPLLCVIGKSSRATIPGGPNSNLCVIRKGSDDAAADQHRNDSLVRDTGGPANREEARGNLCVLRKGSGEAAPESGEREFCVLRKGDAVVGWLAGSDGERAGQPGIPGRGDGIVGWIAKSVWAVPVLALPTAGALWFMRFWGMDTPDQMLKPNLPVLAIYGGFFALGWLFARQPENITRFGRLSVLNVVLAIGGGWAVLALSGIQADPGHPQYVAAHVGFVIGYATLMWSLVALTLGVFRRFLHRPRPVVRYLADSSYWMYLIHLPVVVWLQVAVAEWNAPWWLKLGGISIVTIAIALVTYDLFVRSTFLGALLNGRKRDRALFGGFHRR